MTRDELIEALTRAHYANYFEGLENMEPAFSEQPESHQDRMREAMKAALAAIEAQGMAIVPVEAADATVAAGVDEYENWNWTEEIERDTLRAVYLAMNKASKL